LSSKTPKPKKRDIASLFADSDAMERAMAQAVQDAMIRHKRLGQSVFTWRDGRVVEIPPEEIPEELDGASEDAPQARAPSGRSAPGHSRPGKAGGRRKA